MKMNLYIAICLLAVTASAKANGALGLGALGGLGGLVYAPGHASPDYYAYPRYAFEYAVKDPHTGDNKAQWEKRDGDVVKGAYSLVEPDGSLRVVEYWADDKSGFNAVVKRLGPNLHPATVHAAPIYKAPIPVLGHGPVLPPITVGPVANLGHLAGAPLISGPIHGPAVSTQTLIKEPVPILKPILHAPIHTEPILSAPILPVPIHSAPIIKTPILPGPIYKSGPIYSEPLGPLPIYKAPLPLLKGPIGPIEVGPLGSWDVISGKGPIGPWGGLGKGLGPLNAIQLGGHGLVKGPIGPIGPIEVGPIGSWDVINSKGAIGPWGGLGKGPIGLGHLNPISLGGHGLVKGPIGPIGPIGPLPYDVLEKGPLLPAWNSHLEYPLYPGAYKH